MDTKYGFYVRFGVIAVLLAGTLVVARGVERTERVPARRPLHALAPRLENWTGVDQPLEARVVDAIGADDTLSRLYVDGAGKQVLLYVAYYGRQSTGDTIHSPKNCLPGSGWRPVRAGRLAVTMPGGRAVTVNEYIVEKGLDRQLVLYWYQSRGRVIASEYSAKFWLVRDALLRRRTDGALVRLVASADGGEDRARDSLVSFLRVLNPRLKEFVPE